MMNSDFLIALPFLAFSGALMFLVPQFSPRRYFFAITVPAGFRSGNEARAIARRYHWEMAIIVACCAALAALLSNRWPDLTVMMAVLLPLLSGFVLFLMARSKVKLHAAAISDVREAELTVEGDELPRWTVWALPPFAAPVAAAAYLARHWNQIPQKFPTHFDLQGNANGWSTRSPQSVYGLLALAAGIMAFILLIGVGMYYGARRAPQRAAVLKMLIVTIYFLALIFTQVGLLPLVQISTLWILVLGVAFSIVIVAWSFKLVTDPRMPSEVTPDEYWYLGAIYCNRHDPAIFVQKRVGFGYTLNVGNNLTWLLVGGFVAGMIGLVSLAK